MTPDLVVQFGFWISVAILASGCVYLAHRLTAPAANRLDDNRRQHHYALLAERGQSIPLPATWSGAGLEGHDHNTGAEARKTFRVTTCAILAAWAISVWARSDVITFADMLLESSLAIIVSGGVFLLMRQCGRRRVEKQLAAAGSLAPRDGFRVVANAHGLFVPVEERVIEGAWSDWVVTNAEIEFDKYGHGFCQAITIAHRDRPHEHIPLIASTFENGDELLAVLAARVPRAS